MEPPSGRTDGGGGDDNERGNFAGGNGCGGGGWLTSCACSAAIWPPPSSTRSQVCAFVSFAANVELSYDDSTVNTVHVRHALALGDYEPAHVFPRVRLKLFFFVRTIHPARIVILFPYPYVAERE